MISFGEGAPEAGDGKFVEVGELDADAAKIVPYAAENLFDLGVGFVRECRTQIGAAEPVFRPQRSEASHQRAGKVGRAAPIHALGHAQRAGGHRADGGVKKFDTRLRHCAGPSEGDDDLAEHLPAFEAGKAALEIRECDFGVDHRRKPIRHFGEALADVAHGGAE